MFHIRPAISILYILKPSICLLFALVFSVDRYGAGRHDAYTGYEYHGSKGASWHLEVQEAIAGKRPEIHHVMTLKGVR